jgi:hypothetical protein
MPMSVPPPKRFSRSRVLTGICINLCATPGLGSLMCRRIVSGAGQLLLALAGFCLIVAWMGREFYVSIEQQMDRPVSAAPFGWMWQWGAACFGAAWLWSLVTSVSLWRHAREETPAGQGCVPPRITEPPGENLKMR